MAELRLKEKYKSQVAPQLKDKFGYKNVHQIPKLDKVVINMSVTDAIYEFEGAGRRVERAAADLGSEAGDHEGQEIDRRVQAA